LRIAVTIRGIPRTEVIFVGDKRSGFKVFNGITINVNKVLIVDPIGLGDFWRANVPDSAMPYIFDLTIINYNKMSVEEV